MNYVWVIEGLTKHAGWIPLILPRGLRGVHYTRRQARAVKRELDKINKRDRLLHRVRKYSDVIIYRADSVRKATKIINGLG